jgi:RNA polymerase sigma factor (sigma-70 family)
MINTPDDYKLIDNLVLKYQCGDSTAAEDLINKFHPYMLKYISLLTGGGDVHDVDCRKFLSTFFEDEKIRRALISGKYTPEQRTVIFTSLSNIVQSCGFMEREELSDEMSMVLLTMASRYKEYGRGFTGYVNGAYFHYLSRRIKEITQDPIVYQKENLVSFSDLAYADPDSLSVITDAVDRSDYLSMINEDEELGNSWVQGFDCMDCFKRLTPLERLIIKYKFEKKLTLKRIGQRLGYSEKTIQRKVKKAVEIIRKDLNVHAKEED